MLRALSAVFPAFMLSLVVVLAGCQSTKPDYNRPLPAGAPALMRVAAEDWPDLSEALSRIDSDALQASSRSLAWFAKPSTVQHFPVEGIDHDRARQSTAIMHAILSNPRWSASQKLARIRADFDLYQSVGWNGKGVVLFTGYYAPVLRASTVRTNTFRYPLYEMPSQIVKPDDPTGQHMWRNEAGQIVVAPTRKQLSTTNVLAGNELVWLESPFDVFLVQVQGSARLRLVNGQTMDIGYAADNGHEYTSVGAELIADKQLAPEDATLPGIRRFFTQRPDLLNEYINRNDRFIFFKTYEANVWPAGSLGFPVTGWRSLATDKRIFPRAMPMFVETTVPSMSGGSRAFSQLMWDQDTGGAIRAPGRADIFMGIGPQAEQYAGLQKYEGAFYYFVAKPEAVQAWSKVISSGN